MPDEKPIPDVTAETNRAQLDVLYLLADPHDHPALWTVAEIIRELDDPDATDSINALLRAGLIHRTTDGFIFASRSAVRQVELVGYVM